MPDRRFDRPTAARRFEGFVDRLTTAQIRRLVPVTRRAEPIKRVTATVRASPCPDRDPVGQLWLTATPENRSSQGQRRGDAGPD